MHRLSLLIILFGLAACGTLPERADPGARILAIGDSVLAWNRADNASIVDRVEKRLGAPILDATVPGARMRQGGFSGAVGFSIPRQVRPGEWETIILNGGANDLFGDCNCNACDAVLDRLVQQDYPALLSRLGDADVYFVGYYGPAGDRAGGYDGCDDELTDLERRLMRLAATRPNFTVVPVRQAVTGRPWLYDDDRVHPSPNGSRVIGDIVARALVANGQSAR